ncbi:hypothetical protein [Cellvibrio polysaccharolyticus]|uniref:Uncharacterized protein n=1 Tax=Cellvibrio polysaccharolyticus TaxID=2082724 RepID=A0A928V2I1_9GAMM|nr:hypothetical protein [Cellvibrio polysaccharolyticus]MBE8717578.1 hypothetical protein [Cellvibrio polysaccharolyticus]
MTKQIIYPQDNYIGAWGVTFIIGSIIISLLYAGFYAEIPHPEYTYRKIFNPAALWFAFWILLTGLFTGLLLLGISKCLGELPAIRILMNEEVGRTNEQPSPEAPTTEENTYAHQAPAETKHP